jgi:predicted ABC-class ATPase
MIVLGRGLKQELRLFLKEKKVGEILEKRNFDTNTLQTFIEQHMPIHQILEKSMIEEQLEIMELDLHFQ